MSPHAHYPGSVRGAIHRCLRLSQSASGTPGSLRHRTRERPRQRAGRPNSSGACRLACQSYGLDLNERAFVSEHGHADH
jgi:hypothetical protein